MAEQQIADNPNKGKKVDVVKAVEAEARQQAQQIAKESDGISNLGDLRATAKKFKFADVIVPILSVIILGLITVFVYIPMISNAVQSNDETALVRENVTKLEKLDTQLDQLNIAQLQEDLNDAREVIPYSLQVSDFVYYIDNLSKEKNLVFRDIFAGDVKVQGGEIADDSVISGVNGPLRYLGTLEDITAFLDELQNASPFIVSTDQVDIKKISESLQWEVSVTLTGYYVNKDSIASANIYAPFFAYSKYTEALDVFSEKAKVIEVPEEN